MPTSVRKPRNAYHHGNLREAILQVARKALDQGAYEALSLRELAKRAGVTANAPYRHFASKDEILAEVAAAGFVQMTERFDAYSEPDAKERLIRLCDLYTGFAVEFPHLYRVMFGIDKPALMEHSPLHEAAMACFGRLVAATAAASAPGILDEIDLLKRANAIWTVVHGWSRLAIDGMTDFQPPGAFAPAADIVAPVVRGW
ncbi:MAG: TetR/AcrR family transcriptional regulator [Lysobacteraceae bacterium]|jgi:AcrR family transcriptional regulator|nr:TetR/AcrR family transcriptional regulator [Xanthomonadaceae bacterium]MCZ8317445.1 TetR/AcrR family transcriptional regulator [Silanimonas sp.]